MFRRPPLLFKPCFSPRPSSRCSPRPSFRNITTTSAKHNSKPPPALSKTQVRINTFIDGIPTFLQPAVRGLRNAPVSHVTTFLVLHEITAIVPLVGLAAYFHYSDTLPTTFANSEYVSQGVDKFARYFGRKGWFGLTREHDAVTVPQNVIEAGREHKETLSPGMRVVLEVATAYAITKVLFPVRLLMSAWATPSVARVWLRVVGRLSAGKGVKNPAAMAGLLGGVVAGTGKKR